MLLHTVRNAQFICGACDEPASSHGLQVNADANPFSNVCDRDPTSIGSASWFDDYSNQEVSDYIAYSGPNRNFISVSHPLHGDAKCRDEAPRTNEGHYEPYRFGAPQGDYVNGVYQDEQDYQSPTIEFAKLEAWRDRNVRESNDANVFTCALTLEQHQSLLSNPATRNVTEAEYLIPKPGSQAKTQVRPALSQTEESPEQRNAYVDGNPGFLSIQMLDPILTEKHHQRLLNIFRDAKDNLRIGSCIIEKDFDGSIRARCVNRYCAPLSQGQTPIKGQPYPNPAKTPPINLATVTREQMEQFVWAVIAHGNNHAADWFRNRIDPITNEPTFYALDKTLSEPVVTDDEQYRFLKEHQTHCRDAGCACGERMMQLRPDLYYVALPA